MSSYNRITLIGRLTADPELKYSQAGKAIASCTLAVNRQGKKTDHPEADFIPVTIWEKRGEAFAQYSKKGDERLIEGRLQTRSYTDKDGNKRKAFDVVATDWSFQGGKREQADASSSSSPAQDPDDVGMSDIGMTDDVPF